MCQAAWSSQEAACRCIRQECFTAFLATSSMAGLMFATVLHGVLLTLSCDCLSQQLCLYEFTELNFLSVGSQLSPRTLNILID